MHFFRYLLLVASISLAPLGALAHGDRPSFEAESGPYLIDIGYDVTGFRPGEEVTFDFDLYADAESDHPTFAPFDAIDVRIQKNQETVHSETLENNPTYIPSMTYVFPQSGDYTLGVAYMLSGAVIAQAAFDVAVSAASGAAERAGNTLVYIIAAILVAVSIGYVVYAYRSTKS